MGFAAATGRLELPAFVLAGLLFTWQIPHFLALALLYQEDYARGGYRMLPLVDPGGQATCRMLALYSLALMPMGLVAAYTGLTGPVFGMAALALGAALLTLALRLCLERSAGAARRVFIGSIAYLPLLLLIMLLDPGPYAQGRQAEMPRALAGPGTAASLLEVDHVGNGS
jgi:protoheme IX farnesyltransferase